MKNSRINSRAITSAIIKDDIGFIKKLISVKINLNEYRLERGATPLMLATYLGSVDMMKLLLQSTNNIDAQNDYQSTALMYSLFLSYRDNALLRIKLLIDQGVNLNIQDQNGNTALIIAVKDNRPNIVELLLDSNADRSIKNSKGETALSLSSKYGYSEIVELINNKGN